jgi:hypothetical protein
MIVEFGDGNKVEIRSPQTEIGGIMYGERTFNFFDSLLVKDTQHSLFCDLVFQPDRKSGLKGLISYGASFLVT